MPEIENSGMDEYSSSPLFISCEKAFKLIKEGKEKQAQEMFPLEHYLINKYKPFDFNDLSSLLAKKLRVNI